MYRPICGTLIYTLSPCQRKVLMIHRCTRDDDIHLGLYNGLGGKMEREEDLLTSMKRELYEEAMITPCSYSLRGTINWTNFGPRNEDWLGFIFRVDRFTGSPPLENHEGKLEWVEIDRLSQLPMWDGDRYFLPLVFDSLQEPFHGYMNYQDGKVASWNYVRMM